jgi:hypothetical protein
MINKEILDKYGLEPAKEQLKEDGTVDAETFATLMQSKVRELALQDKDLIDPIRQQAKKEGEIIAIKRAAKALKSKFGIDLSNADLEAKTFDEIAELAAQVANAKTSADAKELNDKLIAMSNKAHEWEESFQSKVAEIERGYQQKYAGKELEKQVLSVAANDKLIISPEKALRLFQSEIKDNGYFYQMDESGKLQITKDAEGKYPVLKDDSTGVADVAYLFDKFMAEFKVKNNGSGAGGQGGAGGGQGKPVVMSDKMRELMKATIPNR